MKLPRLFTLICVWSLLGGAAIPVLPAAEGAPQTGDAEASAEAETVTFSEPRMELSEVSEPTEAGEEEVTEWEVGEELAPVKVEWTRIREVIRPVGGTAYVGPGEETPDVVVVFGEAKIEGRVRHDMVVVLGKAYVNGEVSGDLVAPLTQLELGPKARIGGDMILVGGSLTADPAARVEGERLELTWEQMERDVPGFAAFGKVLGGMKEWVTHGLLLGRLLPPQSGWWWWVALAMALLYLLAAVIVPRAVSAGSTELEHQPVATFFVGILGYILVHVLFFILAATGFGVLALPFLLLAALVVQVVGKASAYQLIGARIGRQFGGGTLLQPFPSLILGLLLFTLLYMVPVLGLLVWLVVAPLGFGAALMAMFQTVRSGPGGPPPALNSGLPSVDGPAAVSLPSNPAPPSVQPVAGPPPVIGSSGGVMMSSAELASGPRAGFWIRTAATLLDLLIVAVPLIWLQLGEYFLLPWIAYHVAMWTWRGTTVGGVVCRLKIVRVDGEPVNFAVALVRSLASMLSAVALLLGFFWVGWTRARLSWHDLIAGTVIVRVPQGVMLL